MTLVFSIVFAITVAIAGYLVFVILDHLFRFNGKKRMDNASVTQKTLRSETKPEASEWYEKPGQQLRA